MRDGADAYVAKGRMAPYSAGALSVIGTGLAVLPVARLRVLAMGCAAGSRRC